MIGELCRDIDGFSFHATVEIEAHDRDGLERICRYLARPPIATERLSLAPDGRVVYALRRHWKDGTGTVVFDPLDFIARLAALVPRPRAHLLTYHESCVRTCPAAPVHRKADHPGLGRARVRGRRADRTGIGARLHS
jgi:hypothetical protein